jgi:DNA-binding MarR family transcriptional regulator
MTGQHVRRLLDLYPKIFHACHTRHVKDPESGNVLSAHQASILDHLDEVEATTLAGLARHSGVTASTMSVAVDRLVRHGYVTRERHVGDGRKVQLRLSPPGVAMRDANSVLDAERVRAMLAHLNEADLEVALGGLELLARAADAEAPNKRLYGLRTNQTQETGGAEP